MTKKKLVDDDTAIDNISSLSTYVDDEDIQNWAIKILDERNKLLNELEMLKVGAERLKNAKIHEIAYSLLGSEDAFNALDGPLKVIYLKMAKRAWDHFMGLSARSSVG